MRVGKRQPTSRPELVVHGAVAHEAMSRGDQHPLEDAVASRQSPGRDAGLLALQQGRACPDSRTCGLAADGRRSSLHPRVMPQALGLPCLVIGAEEGPVAIKGNTHRSVYRRPVAFVSGKKNRLRVLQRREGSAHHIPFLLVNVS